MRYTACALLVFACGFSLFHGREATHAGSWDYIITHDDEYIYWAIAKGSMAAPASDANPFYYEERTRTNPIPSYLMVTAAGRLAAALDIQVLALLPWWKILMPFSLWLMFFLCLVRLWGHPPGASAAVAMIILLGTLFLHGSAQFTLFRFPHPGDGLGLALLWLSLLAHADDMPRRRYQTAMLATGLATLAITPYYTILQVWTLALQCGWEWLICRDGERARSHLLVLLILLVLACGYFVYILISLDQSHWVSAVLDVDKGGRRQLHFPSVLLYGVIGLGVFAARRVCGGLTRLDRLVLFVLALEPLTANVRLVLGQDHQIGLHRYYFIVPEIACLVGWSSEKLQHLVRDPSFRRVDGWAAALLGLVAALVFAHPALNYFRYLPRDVSSFHIFDNSLLLLYLLPILLLGPWLVLRFARVGRLVRRPLVVGAAIAVMALLGFLLQPSQLREFNRAIPFTGAYAWLVEQGVADAVLLTGPSPRATIDYGLFYVDAKSYYNTNGQRFSIDEEAKEHRRFVYAALLHGGLNIVLPEYPTISEKLRHLKLDYILVERIGPYEDNITSQLSGYLREVYRDDRCVLWQLVIP